jgi:hypothetical protein
MDAQKTTSPALVAQFMAQLLRDRALLEQRLAAARIRERFGDEFTYRSRNGQWAIAKPVLTEFRKLTNDDLVWERGCQSWRRRRLSDPRGRMVP